MLTETGVYKITPHLAETLLARNENNRPLSLRYVTTLAGCMTRGEWVMNGEAIIIAASGRLLNGQHRLTAVIESGVTIESLVVVGVDDAVYHTLDGGKKRTLADHLHEASETNTAKLAASIALCWRNDTGNMSSWAQPSTDQAFDWLAENPGIRDSLRVGDAAGGVCGPSIPTYLHYCASRQSVILADRFINGLRTGTNLAIGSPVLLFRERCLGDKASKARLSIRAKVALAAKAMSLFLDGRHIRVLKIGDSEKFSYLPTAPIEAVAAE